MIESVFISGQIGKAIYKEGEQFLIAGLEDFNSPRPCRLGEIAYLLNSGFEFVEMQKADLGEVYNTLEYQRRAHRALSLTIAGFDRELSDRARRLSIEAAEELMQDEQVLAFVKARLFARLLPEGEDIAGAIFLATDVPMMHGLYSSLSSSQWAIQLLKESWQEEAKQVFKFDEDQNQAESFLIETGLFADIVTALASEDRNTVNSKIVSYGTKREVTKNLPGGMLLLNSIRTRILDNFGPAMKRDVFEEQIAVEFDTHAEENEQNIAEQIRELIRQFGKRRKWRASRAHEVQERIDNQIAAISKLIRQRDTDQVNEFLYNLVEFQLRHSEKQHAAMSLCSLAKIALDASSYDLADELIAYSILLNVADPVIGNTRAEILKARGALEEATKAYEENISRFPDNVVARTGYAETLKSKGEFDRALQEYEKAISRFPDDVVARTGYAETLKSKGEFDRALQEYEKAISRFPDDVVARTGYAETLKSKGEFDRALEVYEYVIASFPDNVVARTGYAETLKSKGEFDRALQEYEKAISRFPHNRVARSGLASLYLMKGYHERVHTLLSIEKPVSKDDWIDYHIQAMAFLECGEWQEAIKRLEAGFKYSTWGDTRSYFATALGFANLKRKEFDKAVEVLKENVFHVEFAQEQKRLVLISHAEAARGRKSEAAELISRIKSSAKDPKIISLTDYIAKRYSLNKDVTGTLSESEIVALEGTIHKEEFNMVLAA